MSLLDISGLTLSIGALPILRDVTLSIAVRRDSCGHR